MEVPPPPGNTPPVSDPEPGMSPAKGEIEVADYLVVVLGWPTWMILISFAGAYASGSVTAYGVGAAAGAGLVQNFLLYAPIAAVLTYFTVRWSRASRRRARHEEQVRKARDEFYLNESKNKDRP